MDYRVKLGLGTAQFGMHYGINNYKGVVPFEEVINIIDYYNRHASRPIYDSAIAYGNSHKVLGKAFNELAINNPDVISKFSKTDINKIGLRKSIENALEDIRIESLSGFIAHNANDLIENPKTYDELHKLKEEGLIKKLGISAYYPHQVEWFLDKKIDLIQIPYNIFDQRFQYITEKCKIKGIEIHSRSAFLQGLIFKDLSFFNDYFFPYKTRMIKLLSFADFTQESIKSIALAFALMNNDIDRVIIGVDNIVNLRDNFNEINDKLILQLLDIKNEMSLNKEQILLPFNWPKNEKHF